MGKNKNKKSTTEGEAVADTPQEAESTEVAAAQEEEKVAPVEKEPVPVQAAAAGNGVAPPQEEQKVAPTQAQPAEKPLKRSDSRIGLQRGEDTRGGETKLYRPEFKYDNQKTGSEKIWELMSSYIGSDKQSIQRSIVNHVEYTLARTRFNFDNFGAYQATAYSLRDRMIEAWNDTQQFHTVSNNCHNVSVAQRVRTNPNSHFESNFSLLRSWHKFLIHSFAVRNGSIKIHHGL